MSNKPLTNGKEFVIVDYAIDYVVKQGFIVSKPRLEIAKAIAVLASLALIVILATSVKAIGFDDPSIPKINLPSGVESLISTNDCIILSNSVGDIIISYNLSCSSNGTVGVSSLTSGDNYIVFSSSTGDIIATLNEVQLNATILDIASAFNDSGGVTSLTGGDNYLIFDQNTGDIIGTLNESVLNSTILDIADDFNNSLENPWTNTSTQIQIKSGYPTFVSIGSLAVVTGIIFPTGAFIAVTDKVFCSNTFSNACLVFNHTSALYEFRNIFGGLSFTISPVTNVARFFSDLQVDGNLNVLGNVATVDGKNVCLEDGTNCKTITNYYQASRATAAWANGTFTYLLSSNMAHNFGTNATGIQDRGIYHKGNVTLTGVNIRFTQGTTGLTAPDVDWQLGYRNGSDFITIYNFTFVNIPSGTFQEHINSNVNTFIPELEDEYLIMRAFTITEGVPTTGSVSSLDFGIRLEENI